MNKTQSALYKEFKHSSSAYKTSKYFDYNLHIEWIEEEKVN